MRGKAWTPQEVEYLDSNWGSVTMPHIAKKLDRTLDSIKNKANEIGLKRHLHSGEEITFHQLCEALGRLGNYNDYRKSWVKHGCPVKMKKSIKKKYMVIKIEAFWKWAEKNKQRLDFAHFQENMLGKEPAWVPIKRRADIAALKYKTTPWTITEDNHLISLLNQFKYGYREISEKLCRTEGAIKKRMVDLGLRQRPIRMPNHNPWELENIDKVKTMHFEGCRPEIIAGHVGRSACAVRGLLERLERDGKLLPPAIEKVRKESSTGVHYREALPEDQWGKAQRFLGMIAFAKDYAEHIGQVPDVDLSKFRDAFAQA